MGTRHDPGQLQPFFFFCLLSFYLFILFSGIIVERPQVIVPEREEWLESYESFYAKWNRPILAQIPPLQILDEDISELKGKEKEKEKEKEKDAGKSKVT
jgi:hypothetical protein